jgi:putative membrane protein
MQLAATPLNWTGGPDVAWVFVAGVLYWLGGRRGPARDAESSDGWRTAAFVAGLLAILIALDTPIDNQADRLFWVHMVQHVLLIAVAPPLLAISRPWMRMWRGLPLSFRRDAARTYSGARWRPLRGAVRFVGDPVPSWLIFNVTFIAWHLPPLYDAAIRSQPVHALEHAMFFATALLLWTRVIYSPPWRSPLSELGRVAYLSSTLVVGWVLAIVLALATSPIYAAYADQATRPGGISALTDQQLAAGVMWVPGSLAYTIAIVVIAYRWLEPGGSRARPRLRPAAKST